ncbi:uncharacterized protein LOC141648183 [Silene latifolia]|uniref:uncharacterized protein LOC141648183 n=1 Tax=Silene latifolia TaxID=37657 RepID=UPI003D7827B1
MDTNNYPPYTYPDSTTSSPRSRDLDYENSAPSSFEDHSTNSTTKVKFMVSYGGKIQPRTHDNLLSYLGGDTKILSVDRNVKFTSFYSKLASLVSPDTTSFTFKYQLPGEDLDALISVTNDDDLELMMQEFDRVLRGSGKVARLRLFLFTDQQVSGSGEARFGSASSETGILSGPGSEPVRDVKFVDHRNLQNAVSLDAPRVLSPSPTPPPLPVSVPLPVHSNVDFLFGLERGPVPVPVPGPVREQEMVHDLNRLQISAQEFQHLQMQNQLKQNAMYSSKNDDGFVDPYQKSSQISSGYWQPVEHPNQPPQHPQQVHHHQQYNPQLQQQLQQQQFQQPQHQQQHQQQLLQQQQLQQQQQPVYMMHAQPQANAFHAQPIIRPNQGGYYPVQPQQPPISTEQVYREQQPVYGMPAGAQVVRQAESAYDNATGRQVFYAPGQQGGVVAPPFPGMSAAAAVVVSGGSGDMRRGSGDGKIGHRVTAASPAAV